MKKFVIYIFSFLSFLGSIALAQSKKLDLDDLTIKGELHSDDRLLILSRQKNELKNYIKFRSSFREEILQEIPDYLKPESTERKDRAN